MALRNMWAWEYTDRNGIVWGMGVAKNVSDQLDGGGAAKIGGVAATAKLAPLDPRVTPRHVKCNAADGSERTVTVMNDGADLYAVGKTIDLFQGAGGAAVTYTVYEKVAEVAHYRRRKPGA